MTAVWTRGYREIYAIRIIRRGAPADVRVSKSRRHFTRWLALSFGPAVLSIALIVPLGGTDDYNKARLLFLIALLGVINGGMFAAAILAWRYGLDRAHTVDDLLRPCRRRDHVVSVIDWSIDVQRQSVAPLAFALTPWIVVLIHDGTHVWTRFPFFILLLNTTWSMATLGNVSYWLVMPPIMVMRLRACTDILLRWHDPARTAGIRTFSEGYAYPAFFLALGAFGVTFPGLIDHPIFGAYLPYIYGLLIALSLWIGVLAQVNIYLVVRQFRLRLLDGLAPDDLFALSALKPSKILGTIGEIPQLELSLSAYSSIASSPSLPFGTGTVVQYVAALVGSLAGFLLQ